MSNLRNIWSSLFARPGSGNACYVILAVPGSRGNTRQVMDTGPRTAHSADLLSPLYETQVTQIIILRVPGDFDFQDTGRPHDLSSGDLPAAALAAAVGARTALSD